MMNFILLAIAIYVALVGTSITLMMVMTSKWYINKTKEMTKNIVDDFTDEKWN